MGTCVQKRTEELSEGKCHLVLDYKLVANVEIKRRDSIGRVVGGEPVSFKLFPPVATASDSIRIGNTTLTISSCVVPGQNPRGAPEKVCQDGLFIDHSDNSLFLGLFDGHGVDGLKVVDFCKQFATLYYQDHVFEFKHDPSMAITLLCEICDKKLKEQPDINCAKSGTTAVFAYFNEFGLCIGSVGDSRGVQAFLPQKIQEEFTLGGATVAKSKKKKNTNPYKRDIVPSRVLDFTQVTVDQKPENKEELQRIIKSGGNVEKAKDGRGVRVGPYRVWKRGTNFPGLAMSRSLGDKEGELCGVIPTPIVKTFKSHPKTDQFLVIASDGVWDVFENIECVNFVERYRKSAQRESQCTLTKANPRISNTTIAHLLCEEARLRWLGIVEDEGVMIDDISCHIVEIGNDGPMLDRGTPESPRSILKSPEPEEEKETEEFNADELNAEPTPFFVRHDAKRGSMVDGDRLRPISQEDTEKDVETLN